MNKVFLGLILAVCVLGMALVMLNDRLGRRQEARPPVSERVAPVPGRRTTAEIEAAAKALEIAQAAVEEAPLQEKRTDDEPVRMPSPVQQIPQINPEPGPAAEAPQASTPELPGPELQPEPVRTAPVKPEPPRMEPVKPVAPKTEQAQSGPHEANRFVIYARERGATVRLGSKGKMEYSSMTLDNPDRVVVDLAGDWKFPPNPGVPKNDLVSAVRVGKNGDKTRVVIDLKIKPRKVVLVPFKNGDGVDVRVDR